jgi:hypothetical protein
VSFFSCLRYVCDLGDAHDARYLGDAHDACYLGDAHDACYLGDAHDACYLGDAHDARDLGDVDYLRDFGAASLPDLAPENPARIICQLHPSNPRYQTVVDFFPNYPMLAPLLIAAKCALA